MEYTIGGREIGCSGADCKPQAAAQRTRCHCLDEKLQQNIAVGRAHSLTNADFASSLGNRDEYVSVDLTYGVTEYSSGSSLATQTEIPERLNGSLRIRVPVAA